MFNPIKLVTIVINRNVRNGKSSNIFTRAQTFLGMSLFLIERLF